jgi:zinc transporter ZupT
MRIERILTTPATPDAARTQITAYLEQAGYKASGLGLLLRFERSSILGSESGPQPFAIVSRAAVEIRTGQGQETWVCATVTVDQEAYARTDPAFWQQEMDGLVTSVDGTEVHLETAAAQTLAPAFILHQPAAVDPYVQINRRVRSGANWFFWIAGLSIVNSIAYRLGLKVTYLIGLAGTMFIEGVAIGLAAYMPNRATLMMGLALVGEILVAGIFVVLGLLARRGLRWAFILGLVFYALDGIIYLVFGDFAPAAFHLLGLFGIVSGLRALGER